ncbi:hypothetical protein M885DRAFT_114935 [Pelagophyceae sp. CCMP2097]|nr:hypothetical protein M885DRAFT_114935 [Pelagophyceae sp. CCMP2097]
MRRRVLLTLVVAAESFDVLRELRRHHDAEIFDGVGRVAAAAAPAADGVGRVAAAAAAAAGARSRRKALRLESAGLNLTLDLRPSTGVFAEGYAEYKFSGDYGAVERRVRPACHYEGVAKLENSDRVGRVTAHTCNGGALDAVVRFPDNGDVFEIRWHGETGRHIVFDALRDHAPRRDFSCGVRDDHDDESHDQEDDDDHDHEDHDDHDHRGHDHDDHDHEDHGSASGRERTPSGRTSVSTAEPRRLRSGECDSEPVKYVEVVAFNDASRVAEHGDSVEDETALILSLVNDLYDGLQSSVIGCAVKVRLLGQVSWASAPTDVDYVTGAGCAQRCGDTCSPNEVSATCLLASFGEHVSANRGALAQLFGGRALDNAHLLTARDFAGGSVGLGYVGTMCQGGTSASVESSFSSSLLFVATVVAHELGHNLGMQHDSSASPGFIMAAASPSGPSGTNFEFSDESRNYANDWFQGSYGRDRAECLENDEPAPGGNACGDGIVGGDEECDSGYWALGNDVCCQDDCTLAPGCDCATTGACCTATGKFAEAGALCRAKRHAACDAEETCSGVKGDCPMDLFQPAGTSCREVRAFDGRATDGVCYRGECATWSDNCVTVELPFACESISSCDLAYCSSVAAGQRRCIGSAAAEAGTSCGESSQCVASGFEAATAGAEGTCVLSTTLRKYHWDAGADDCSSEALFCANEAGVAVAASLCDNVVRPTYPARCTVSPSVSPAPTVSPMPTPRPTFLPTAAPSVSFEPTPSPTDRASKKSKSVSSQTSFIAAALLIVGFVILAAALTLFFIRCCRRKDDNVRRPNARVIRVELAPSRLNLPPNTRQPRAIETPHRAQRPSAPPPYRYP